jgi:hypothetical protein
MTEMNSMSIVKWTLLRNLTSLVRDSPLSQDLESRAIMLPYGSELSTNLIFSLTAKLRAGPAHLESIKRRFRNHPEVTERG